jgi:hypothetical protein
MRTYLFHSIHVVSLLAPWSPHENSLSVARHGGDSAELLVASRRDGSSRALYGHSTRSVVAQGSFVQFEAIGGLGGRAVALQFNVSRISSWWCRSRTRRRSAGT